jgi:hypothetical protein
MVKNIKRVLIAGGLGLLGAAVWRIRKRRRDTEDRPPIVVNEGSFVIANVTKAGVRAKDWVRDGASEKWKMKHPDGKHATGYDVVVTKPRIINAGSGAEVLIHYFSGAAKYQFQFYLDPHPSGRKMEPAVSSTQRLAPDNRNRDRKTITYPAAGEVRRLEVAGNPDVEFGAHDSVEIRLTVRY